MTRLEQWAERVTREMLRAFHATHPSCASDDMRAVLEREARALAEEYDLDPRLELPDMLQAWLDSPVTRSTETGEPKPFLCVNITGCIQDVVCKESCTLAHPETKK